MSYYVLVETGVKCGASGYEEQAGQLLQLMTSLLTNREIVGEGHSELEVSYDHQLVAEACVQTDKVDKKRLSTAIRAEYPLAKIVKRCTPKSSSQ